MSDNIVNLDLMSLDGNPEDGNPEERNPEERNPEDREDGDVPLIRRERSVFALAPPSSTKASLTTPPPMVPNSTIPQSPLSAKTAPSIAHQPSSALFSPTSVPVPASWDGRTFSKFPAPCVIPTMTSSTSPLTMAASRLNRSVLMPKPT